MSRILTLLLILALLAPAAAFAQGADIDDWRAGEPALSDNFSRNAGAWTTDTGADALRRITRGRLLLDVPEDQMFRWSLLDAGDPFSDFYVEVDATFVDGPADGMMGVVFRYTDADNFYAFLTSADGYYALIAYVDGELDRLIDWAETDALEVEGTNTLGVLAVGRELVVFANDEELDRVTDRAFSEGVIGLLGGTSNDGGLETSFDNFSLWTGKASAAATPASRGLRRSTPTPGAAQPSRPAVTADAVVASDTLNVRAGPGTNYAVVGTLKRGDAVTIIGRSGNSQWAKLGFNNLKEAWVSAQYLTINVDFAAAAVAAAPPAPTAAPRPTARPAAKNVAYLVIENHIGRYITVQVNDKNFRVEGKVGNTPGRYTFELQGVGRYRVAAQLPNAGAHNWDLYVEPTADKCANRQGCIALGQTFTQTYY